MEKNKTTYFQGDLAEYTGKKENHYGALFFEVRLLEGHLKGETRLVLSNPPPYKTVTN
jgi:hypothetical protein